MELISLHPNFTCTFGAVMEKEELQKEWKAVEKMLAERFGKAPNLEGILFLIGIQELGKGGKKFTKEQKQDLMHIAVCSLLSKKGYYQLDHYDNDGWPHFKELKKVPGLTLEEQENFLKQQVIQYFKDAETLTFNADNHSTKS